VLDPIVSALPADQRRLVELDAEDVEWELDAVAVERVVGNLVGNALRHGLPPVRVRASRVNNHLEIAVEDEGSGVPEELRPRLFERFERAGRDAGHGLGLAIARAYARAHGGELTYEPRVPTGARFAFLVPH
jgi:two-component system sensor histidine kinase MtrB